MNILIPHGWLKEYLDTKARPEKIAECLSLCGASVEKINKLGKDFVYDIEVTTNRVDMMSVLGIAREAAAILPQFGIKAKLKKDPYKEKLEREKLKIVAQNSKLKLEVKNPKLCPRFTAIILDNITIKPSPKLMQNRLKKAGMRPINNIVDITNYLMKELGQPLHAFDWEQIKKQTMILRESKKGEEITTLDEQTHKLPGGDIVIEDGSKRLIDLCGIMGGSNSHVNPNTKTILLFVQAYDPVRIRQTSMKLAKRSEAAALFEKSPDPEMVLPAIKKGIQLIKQTAGAKIASLIIDVYPKPYKPKKVKVSLQLIKQYLDLDIKPEKIEKILESLGFKAKLDARRSTLITEIPSWRANDVNISEDLIEEVARLVGYHNLPSKLPPLYQQPPKSDYDFSWETEVKQTLKNWGFIETYTYSLVSKEMVQNFGLDPKEHLKLKNPLTEDNKYLRLNLLPSLLEVVKENQNLEKELNFFELANIYLPRRQQLPEELLKLTLVSSGGKFYQLKGVVEALLQQLGLKRVSFKAAAPDATWLQQASIYSQGKLVGQIGYLNPQVCAGFEIKTKVAAACLDFDQILSLATRIKKYHPIPKYPPIIEDLTFTLTPQTTFTQLKKNIKSVNKLVHQIKLLDTYKNNLTLRVFYLDPKKNLTDKKVGQIRKKIILKVKQQELGKLRGKVKGLD